MEDGKITEHLVAEGDLQVLHFFRHMVYVAEKFDHLGRDAPVDGFNLRLGREVQQPEREHRIRLLPDFLRIMQALQPVLAPERAVDIEDVLDHRRITFGRLDLGSAGNFFDRAERFDDEDRMMRGNGASALADQDGMGHFFLVANFLHRGNHITGVLMQGVVDRTVEGRARPVVVDAEAATHVEVTELMPELVQLGVEARRLAHRTFDRTDVRDLRPDVEVHQLEAMGHAFAPEEFAGLDQFRGGEAELGILTAARRPLAGTFGGETDPGADPRFDPHLLGDGQDLREFLDFFHHHDEALAQLASKHGIANVVRILVAVANDEAFRVGMHGERGEEFRLAAGLEAEMEWFACVDNLFDHLAQLVDFDRKNAAVDIGVAGARNGFGESFVDGFDAVAEQVLEAQGHREGQTARACLGDKLHHIHLATRIAAGAHGHVTAAVDREIRRAPALHIVERQRGGCVPIFHLRAR